MSQLVGKFLTIWLEISSLVCVLKDTLPIGTEYLFPTRYGTVINNRSD